ncbi:MAG: hypothetical protein OES10_08285 [Gammaproteobacteria bacterium]|nr:hypothetical protein [Gammaproteobacteria bacterium]
MDDAYNQTTQRAHLLTGTVRKEWTMWTSPTVGTLIACLLLAGYAVGPEVAIAQDAQLNETDLEFSKRMTQRVKNLQARIDQLEKVVGSGGPRSTSEPTRTPGTSSQDDFLRGPQARTAGGSGSDQYRRMEMKLNSLNKKAEAERKRLQAPQGSQSKSKKLDRESIESKVRRMERDLEGLERDLRRY